MDILKTMGIVGLVSIFIGFFLLGIRQQLTFLKGGYSEVLKPKTDNRISPVSIAGGCLLLLGAILIAIVAYLTP